MADGVALGIVVLGEGVIDDGYLEAAEGVA